MVLIFRSAIPNPVAPFKFSQNKKILTNKSELFPEISSCFVQLLVCQYQSCAI